MAIVNLDKVLSGVNGNLEHVKLYSDADLEVPATDYPNGTFATLKGYDKAGIEVRSAVLAEKGDNDIVMLHSPELDYDERILLRDYRNKEGSVTRAYRPAIGDIYSFTVDLLPSGTAVGQFLNVVAGKLTLTPTMEGDSSLVLEVIEDMKYELDTKEKAFALQVVQTKRII